MTLYSLPDEVMPGGSGTSIRDLPSKLRVSGVPFREAPDVTTPMPGHPGWFYNVHNHPLVSDAVLVVWFKKGTNGSLATDTAALIAHVFNRNQSVLGSAIAVSWDVDGETQVAMLAGMCGREWWSLDFTLSLATVESTPWDAWLLGLIAKSATESDSTKDTGSAVIESWRVVRSIADRYGVSPAVAAYYAAFSRETAERPRFALTMSGEPVGAFGQKLSSPDWSTWTFSPFSGKNPGDEQHLDIDELVDGYELTGCPVFLWHVLTFWLLCRLELPVFQVGAAYADSGSARSPAYAIEVSSHLFRVVRKIPQLALTFGVFALATIDSLVTRSMLNWRILSPYYYGGPPPEFQKSKTPYLMVFQAAVMAWGCQEAFLALRGQGPKADAVATKALGFADQILDEFEHSWHQVDPVTEVDRIAYAVDKDDSLVHWHTIGAGVDWWALPAFDRRGWGDRTLPSAIWASVEASGWTDPKHKYHTAAVKSAAPRLGYQTELIET